MSSTSGALRSVWITVRTSGFVNPHAKRDRRNHYLDFARKELLLDSLAVLRIEPGVIRRRGDVIGEFGCQACGLLSSGCVDDGRSLSLGADIQPYPASKLRTRPNVNG